MGIVLLISLQSFAIRVYCEFEKEEDREDEEGERERARKKAKEKDREVSAKDLLLFSRLTHSSVSISFFSHFPYEEVYRNSLSFGIPDIIL